jgi:hypothetical protein
MYNETFNYSNLQCECGTVIEYRIRLTSSSAAATYALPCPRCKREHGVLLPNAPEIIGVHPVG